MQVSTPSPIEHVIEQAAGHIKDGLVDSYLKQAYADLKHWEDRIAEEGRTGRKTDIYEVYDDVFVRADFARRERLKDLVKSDESAPRMDRGDVRKTDEEIQEWAEKRGQEAVVEFIHKMTRKFQGLGEVLTARFDGNGSWNHFYMTFPEDTSLVVENSVTINCSPKGKLFNQFPTRFSSFILRGERVKSPSEKKVKQLLATLEGQDND